jgi:SET domain-containing protein 6
VEKWGEGDECESDGKNKDEIGNDETNTSAGSGMDVDDNISADAGERMSDDENGTDNSDDENDDDLSDIAMVPMADMLNARFGMENVCIAFSPVMGTSHEQLSGKTISRRACP